VLRGLLGNDLLEFQIDRYAQNFLDCVEKFIEEAHVDHARQVVHFRDRTAHVGAFPISIDVQRFEQMASSPESEARVTTLRERYAKGDRQLGVCVDRIDYTKGIPERIRALETLWTESAELRGRFTFIFVCTPSRTDLKAYNTLEAEVVQSVIAINKQFGTSDWTPIVLINMATEPEVRGFSLVYEYIQDNYREAARQNFGSGPDYAVLVKKDLPLRGTDPSLGLPCYR